MLQDSSATKVQVLQPVLNLFILLIYPNGEAKTTQQFICKFNVHGSVHRNNILVYNSNRMHKSQSLFYLIPALYVSGVTITHPQEHKTTVTTACGNRYTVIDIVKFTDKEYR
jgi:hypothetical protein